MIVYLRGDSSTLVVWWIISSHRCLHGLNIEVEVVHVTERNSLSTHFLFNLQFECFACFLLPSSYLLVWVSLYNVDRFQKKYMYENLLYYGFCFLNCHEIQSIYQ